MTEIELKAEIRRVNNLVAEHDRLSNLLAVAADKETEAGILPCICGTDLTIHEPGQSFRRSRKTASHFRPHAPKKRAFDLGSVSGSIADLLCAGSGKGH